MGGFGEYGRFGVTRVTWTEWSRHVFDTLVHNQHIAALFL